MRHPNWSLFERRSVCRLVDLKTVPNCVLSGGRGTAGAAWQDGGPGLKWDKVGRHGAA